MRSLFRTRRCAGRVGNGIFPDTGKTPLLSPEDVPLQPVDVMPGAQMRILFTKEPSELRVMRAVSDKPTEYLELSDAGGGRFSTPTTPGLYFIKYGRNGPAGALSNIILLCRCVSCKYNEKAVPVGTAFSRLCGVACHTYVPGAVSSRAPARYHFVLRMPR